MSGKPIPEEAVAQVCDRMLTAAIGKDWRKRAPEAVTAFWMGEVREALQEVVPALTAARKQKQESGGEVIQRHVVTKYRDGSVHVADAAAPPSAPVGALGQQSGAVAPTTAECPHDWGQDEAHEDWARCYKCGISRRKPIAQQPAAVDGAMLRKLRDYFEGINNDEDGDDYRNLSADAMDLIDSALAAQPGGAE